LRIIVWSWKYIYTRIRLDHSEITRAKARKKEKEIEMDMGKCRKFRYTTMQKKLHKIPEANTKRKMKFS
jgi:hypothetical protein